MKFNAPIAQVLVALFRGEQLSREQAMGQFQILKKELRELQDLGFITIQYNCSVKSLNHTTYNSHSQTLELTKFGTTQLNGWVRVFQEETTPAQRELFQKICSFGMQEIGDVVCLGILPPIDPDDTLRLINLKYFHREGKSSVKLTQRGYINHLLLPLLPEMFDFENWSDYMVRELEGFRFERDLPKMSQWEIIQGVTAYARTALETNLKEIPEHLEENFHALVWYSWEKLQQEIPVPEIEVAENSSKVYWEKLKETLPIKIQETSSQLAEIGQPTFLQTRFGCLIWGLDVGLYYKIQKNLSGTQCSVCELSDGDLKLPAPILEDVADHLQQLVATVERN